MSTNRPGALVVDTSAAVAVILDEAAGPTVAQLLMAAPARVMSAATRVELGIVLEARLGAAGSDTVATFLRDARIEIAPVDTEDADRALRGWRRFGKGNHRARLNFGDCFVYALADRTGLPVLCTGDDFAATDLEVVRPHPR